METRVRRRMPSFQGGVQVMDLNPEFEEEEYTVCTILYIMIDNVMYGCGQTIPPYVVDKIYNHPLIQQGVNLANFQESGHINFDACNYSIGSYVNPKDFRKVTPQKEWARERKDWYGMTDFADMYGEGGLAGMF